MTVTEQTKTNARPHLPFFAASLLFLAGLLWVGVKSIEGNGHHFTYTLDDPYIHMAMAKNLALHNVFGVTRYEFSSSSSSPLWTLLLAASYKNIGARDWIPGMWAALFALGSLFLTNVIGRRFHLSAIARLVACLFVVYFTPLIPLVSTGMEHSMHLFFIILLLHRAALMLESPDDGRIFLLGLAAALATAARYETLFVAAPLAIAFCARQRFAAGLALLAGAFLPVVIYGLFSAAHGSYFLPNSLMLKGGFHEIAGVRGFVELVRNPHLAALCALLLFSALVQAARRGALFWLSLALPAAVIIHLQLARAGMFYRYEAYLVGAGVTILSAAWLPMLAASKPKRALAALAVGLPLLWPLHSRGIESLGRVAFASRNIYDQQYQLGQFLKTELPPGTRVALNDLGAMTYYADVRVLDLVGLGSIEVARARREKKYDTRMISGLLAAHGTEMVVVYTNWFKDGRALPSLLRPVGTWTMINHNYVCGGSTVTFFGTSRENAGRLRKAFRHYSRSLPASVRVEEIKSADATAKSTD